MKKTLFFIINILFILAGCVTAQAQEQGVSVELEEDYDICKFEVSWTGDNENVAVTVSSPDGRTYEETTDTYTAVINVRDSVSGTWSVSVSGDNIEDVIVNVKGIVSEAEELSTPLTIGKSINGLNFHMDDNDLVISWTDTTVGNVSVSVTNTENMQILYNEIIADNRVVYDLSGISEVMVSIVPTVSAGMEGAASQYIISTGYSPDAEVIFPDTTCLNTTTITADVILNNAYYVVTSDTHGNEIKSEFLDAGEYMFDISTYAGENMVTVYVEDINGNRKSYGYTCIVDLTAPQLSLIGEIDGISTYEDSITISGNVMDQNALYVNGREVAVSDNGNFEYQYDLLDGENFIVVLATDEAGNSTDYRGYVTKIIAQPKKHVNPAIVVMIVLAVVCIAVVVILMRMHKIQIPKIRKKENRNSEERATTEKKKFKLSRNDKFDIMLFVVPVGICLFTIKFILYLSTVPSSSMSPTIRAEDKIIVNRLAYVVNEPQRGDIVAFESKEKGYNMIKRIIGLPGETIEFHDGSVYINGELLVEDYIPYGVETNPILFDMAYTVPDGCYFMLGDNRENSADSRYWINPFISKDDIIGKLIVSF